jgi:hypothetical protein
MEITTLPKFSQATSLKDVIGNIEVLFEKAGIVPKWGDEIENALSVSFLGFKTILTISNRGPTIEIRIFSPDDPETRDFCLGIVIANDSEKGGVGSYIEQLGISDGTQECPIPKIKGGTWLVMLAKTLLCLLGVRYSHLDDDSSIKCQNGFAKLVLLRTFQGIYKRWYENFGFKSDKDITEDMKALHDYPASTIISELKSSSDKRGFYSLRDKRSILVDILTEYPPANKNLGEYMYGLWTAECTKYIELQSLLMYGSGGWSKYVNKIFETTELSNENVCI